MGSIRINELARELEVKSRAILDCLKELGITEKKSHSSSLDDETADKVRAYFSGEEDLEPAAPKQAEAAPAKTAPASKGRGAGRGCSQAARQAPGNSDGAAPVLPKIDCGNQGSSAKTVAPRPPAASGASDRREPASPGRQEPCCPVEECRFVRDLPSRLPKLLKHPPGSLSLPLRLCQNSGKKPEAAAPAAQPNPPKRPALPSCLLPSSRSTRCRSAQSCAQPRPQFSPARRAAPHASHGAARGRCCRGRASRAQEARCAGEDAASCCPAQPAAPEEVPDYAHHYDYGRGQH